MIVNKERLWALMATSDTVFCMATDLVESPGAPRGVPAIGAEGRALGLVSSTWENNDQ